MKPQRHDYDSVALVYVRCLCGWEHRIEVLKGKTDEDLAIETGQAFEGHKKSKAKET